MHPEFGYDGTSSFSRTLVVFGVCGVIAGVVTVAIFSREPDRDSMDAMALAPGEALIDTKVTLPETQPPSGQKTGEEVTNASSKPGSIKPTCRESLSEMPEGDCTPVRALRLRPLRSANKPPLIAAVPIGHRDDPRTLAAPPPDTVAATPSPPDLPEQLTPAPAATETSVAEATPADAPPAAEPTSLPPLARVPSKKPQPSRVHHAQHESHRRSQYSYASSYSGRSLSYSFQDGYARVW